MTLHRGRFAWRPALRGNQGGNCRSKHTDCGVCKGMRRAVGACRDSGGREHPPCAMLWLMACGISSQQPPCPSDLAATSGDCTDRCRFPLDRSRASRSGIDTSLVTAKAMTQRFAHVLWTFVHRTQQVGSMAPSAKAAAWLPQSEGRQTARGICRQSENLTDRAWEQAGSFLRILDRITAGLRGKLSSIPSGWRTTRLRPPRIPTCTPAARVSKVQVASALFSFPHSPMR